jgi:hypothetical protein
MDEVAAYLREAILLSNQFSDAGCKSDVVGK